MKKRSFEQLLAVAARARQERLGDEALGTMMWAIELAFGSRSYSRVCELAGFEHPIQRRVVPTWGDIAAAVAQMRVAWIDHPRPGAAGRETDLVVKRDDGTLITLQVKPTNRSKGTGKQASQETAPPSNEFADEVSALLRARDIYERGAGSFESLCEELAENRAVAR